MLQKSIAEYCNRVVFTVPPESTLMDAVKVMGVNRISSVVVTEEGSPVGIITNRDLPRLHAKLHRIPAVTVREVMSAPLRLVDESITLYNALELMISHKLRHLPVVDDQGVMKGMITETDVTDAISADEMMRMIRICEIMVEKVITVPPTSSLNEALMTMHQSKIGSVVVLEGKHPVGLLTLKDLPDLMLNAIDPETTVDVFMKQPVYTEQGDTIAQHALERMKRLALSYLVVVNVHDEIIGLVSRSCFTRNMTRQGIARVLQSNQKLQMNVEQLEAQLHAMQVREMGNLFSHIVNNSPDAILICQQGRVISCNERARGMLGEELMDRTIHDLVNEQTLERMMQERDDPVRFLVHGLTRDDGMTLMLESNAVAISYNGELALLLTMRDISQRLREHAFHVATSSILEKTIRGEAAALHQQVAKMLEERFVACRCSVLLYDGECLRIDAASSMPESYMQAMDGGIHPDVQMIHASAGRTLNTGSTDDPLAQWHQACDCLRAYPLMVYDRICDARQALHGLIVLYLPEHVRPNEEVVRHLAVATRLSSVAIGHQQNYQSTRKLKMAVESSGESMVITDLGGSIEYVNPAFSRQTGYTPDEVMGKNPRILKSGIQDSSYYEKMWSTITSGEVFHAAIVDRRKDGSFYPSMMTISPILDEEGRITHYVSTQQDLTEYEVIEEQLRQAQKMESLGVLVGGIAHNFNNMLAGLAGNLYLAKMSAKGNGEMIDNITTSEGIVFRAKDMIQQLMAFARKGHVQKKNYHLQTLVEDAVNTARYGIREDVELLTHCHTDVGMIYGDNSQLQQVVMNLLNNASDAVAKTSIRRIEVSLTLVSSETIRNKWGEQSAQHWACLRVMDSGIGISKEGIDHIFEPFYTTKEVGQGTGLGLSMSLGTVQSHGGSIEVSSLPGAGTEFRVYLPVSFDVAAASKRMGMTKPSSESDSLSLGILLVDDEDIIVNSYRKLLEKMGANIFCAKNGKLAVDLYQQHSKQIDIMISDVVMPKMGGLELMYHLRTMAPELPVVFVTGYDASNIRLTEEEARITRVINKPFQMETLIALLQELQKRPDATA